MAKKFVVRRDIRKPQRGGPPYLKYLVFSAMGLIFLVVITPYLLRDRSREPADKKPVPEFGAVTKQLPKQAQRQPAPQTPSTSPAATTPETVGSTVSGASTTPPEPTGAVKPTQTQPAPGPAQKGLAASNQASPQKTVEAPPSAAPEKAPAQPHETQQKALFPASEKASAPEHPAETAQSAHKQLFPKKGNRFEGPVAGAENAHAKAAKQTGGRMRLKNAALSAKPGHEPMTRQSAKPAVCLKANGAYAVQVGSIYRTLGQAQALQRRLAARGYSVSIHRAGYAGYLVATSPISMSKAYTLREQMNAVGVRDTKVVGACAPAE